MNDDKVHIKSIKRIIYVGDDEYKEKTTVFNSRETCNELIFNFTGKNTVKFNGKVLNEKPMTLRYLPKGEIKEYVVERDIAGDCVDIFFDSDTLLADEAFILDFSDNTKMENLFKKAFAIWCGKEDGYYYEALGITYEILANIYKKRYITKNASRIIEPAVKYIAENLFKHEIKIPHLAFVCGISESYLKKMFIKKYGLSPKKYIISLKINYAQDLLNSQMMSVTAISDFLGYGNIYHFSKEFKKHIGISPTEYAKKFKSSK